MIYVYEDESGEFFTSSKRLNGKEPFIKEKTFDDVCRHISHYIHISSFLTYAIECNDKMGKEIIEAFLKSDSYNEALIIPNVASFWCWEYCEDCLYKNEFPYMEDLFRDYVRKLLYGD